MARTTQPIALTIAGSDSGGGAGVQADLKTFTAFGCFGTSVITAVTAQNTLGVHAIHSIPVDIIDAQLQALANDLPPAACKTGMLATASVITVAATAIRANGWAQYVCDPVMMASSGDALVEPDALMALRHYLLPLAACVTPNLDEAEALTGLSVRDPEAMVRAGRALLDLGARAALIKGGHLDSDILVDVLVTTERVERFTRSRVVTRATHGTGCTLSAAITAQLAREVPIADAVRKGIEHVQRGIRNAPNVGAGNGPLG